ncbi:MAG: ATP-binding protein [Candidatus Woesearchaeota archaeon]|nr:ATP-binding protein [Candidatus Woesearchaeota archaeon]
MMPDVIQIDGQALREGRKQAKSRMQLWGFTTPLQYHVGGRNTKEDLEKVVTSAEQTYGLYEAVMKTLLPLNPLGKSDEVIAKKALNLYALYVGCSEGLEALANGQDSGAHIERQASIPIGEFGFGIGKPDEYRPALDNLLKYHTKLFKTGTPALALQREFLAVMKKTIEREMQQQAYETVTGQLAGVTLAVNERMYRGFENGMQPSVEAAQSPEIVQRLSVSKNPGEIVVIGNDEALGEMSGMVKQLLLYDPASQTNVAFEGVKPVATLLFGPPGTGKTTIIKRLYAEAQTAATHKGVPVQWVNFDNSFKDMYHGNDVKNLMRRFDQLKDPRKISIGSVEDVDSVLQARSAHDASHIESQAINVFLNELDGLLTEYRGNYILIFTTNHVEKMDSALMNRITQHFEIRGPQTPVEYAQLFRYKMGDALPRVQMDKDGWQEFCRRCVEYSFSGRDIDKIAAVARKYVVNADGITPAIQTLPPNEQRTALAKMRRPVDAGYILHEVDQRHNANRHAELQKKRAATQHEYEFLEARYEAQRRFENGRGDGGNGNGVPSAYTPLSNPAAATDRTDRQTGNTRS